VTQTLQRHQEEPGVGKSSEKHGRVDISTVINRLRFATEVLEKKGPERGAGGVLEIRCCCVAAILVWGVTSSSSAGRRRLLSHINRQCKNAGTSDPGSV
jgi:hypothetical protein